MNFEITPRIFQEAVQSVSNSDTKAIRGRLLQNYARNAGDTTTLAENSGSRDGRMDWKIIFGIVFGLTMFFGLLAAFYFISRWNPPPPESSAPPKEAQRNRMTLGRVFDNMKRHPRQPDERSSYAATSSVGQSSVDADVELATPHVPPAAYTHERASHGGPEVMPTNNNLQRTI